MPVIIGIDEAGYGPKLGPLAVGSAAFGADDEGDDLWEVLAPTVARTKRDASGRLVVADSKAVYAHRTGLAYLERTVLAFVAARTGRIPTSLRALLQHLCVDADTLCEGPWWDDVPLPAEADPQSIETSARQLASARQEAPFLGMAAQVVRAGRFNELIEKHRNKSVLLFQQNMALIERAVARFEGDLSFVIDKHGGRHYYQPLLANNFFGRPIRVLAESPVSSSYEVELDGRMLRFTFAEKADAACLPVALASMTCKYVRELFMMCFNAYWCGRVQGLAPTAGYAADATRFIEAVRPLLDGADTGDMIRAR